MRRGPNRRNAATVRSLLSRPAFGAGGALLLARRALTDPRGALLATRVLQLRLTYLDAPALLELRECALAADRENRPGTFIEAGCALGGSAIVLAASKAVNRHLLVHDVFSMIPPPSDRDGTDATERYEAIIAGNARGIEDDAYYGYKPNLLDTVRDNFHAFGIDLAASRVQLIEGLFQDTLVPPGPVALAHIDGDWYDSVAVCLERIWPSLVPGGVIVVDDYDDWSGCRRAVDEFVQVTPDARTIRRSRLHLLKD